LIRLAVRCRRADAERALAELLELAPGGVEEVVDPDGAADKVEYAVYGAPGELPDVGAFSAAVGDTLVDVRSEPVPDDWEERWKRFYFPVLVGGRLYVRPPWERPAERGGVVEVVIDPGRGFGTGTHATTRMCLELLVTMAPGNAPAERLAHLARLALGRPRERASFCDLGSGSGVLAIAAAKLGFEPVVALDVDAPALEETDRNARANYVDVDVRRADLRTETPPTVDLAAANLTTRLLERLAERWAGPGSPPGALIASGFLARETDGIAAAFSAAGLVERRRLAEGDWGAVLATRS
jgi:ribosomal protein L11 methyltransferase